MHEILGCRHWNFLCYFNANLSATGDTIDRVVSDSVSVTLTLNQTTGNPQNIAVNILSQLPQGVTYTINPNPQMSSGTVTITFHATPFAQSGTYPVVIQSLCGPNIVNQVFSLYIEPCYILNVINSAQNYNLSADLYATYQNVPTNTPICVTAIDIALNKDSQFPTLLDFLISFWVTAILL